MEAQKDLLRLICTTYMVNESHFYIFLIIYCHKVIFLVKKKQTKLDKADALRKSYFDLGF